MAYKDEYEVERLYTDGRFIEKLKQQFEGDFTLRFNLAPPLAERTKERQLIREYRDTMLGLLVQLDAERLSLAIEIASLPLKIRGFGHVKQQAVERYRTELDTLTNQWRGVHPEVSHAA